MVKTRTPKYRLECRDNKGPFTVGWHMRPTEKALESWRVSYNKSLEIGGVNEHISLSLGFVPYINSAKIIEQKTGNVVAEYQAPMFQVI